MKQSIFIQTIKQIRWNIVLMMLFYIIPIITFLVGWLILTQSLGDKASSVNMPKNLDELMKKSEDEQGLFISNLEKYYYTLIIYPILILLLTMIAWSTSKGFIYSMIFNKGYGLKYLIKLFLLTLIWLTLWIGLSILLSLIVKKDYLAYLIILVAFLWIHFSIILFTVFTKDNKFSAIKKAFSIVIKKIHKFLLPYLIIIGLFLLLMLIMFVYNLLPMNIFLLLTLITFLFIISFSRMYTVNVVKSI